MGSFCLPSDEDFSQIATDRVTLKASLPRVALDDWTEHTLPIRAVDAQSNDDAHIHHVHHWCYQVIE